MKDNILEIRITKISKEYSAVDIIKFNSEIEYDEEDIFLRGYDNFPQYRHEDKVLYINNMDLKKPFAIRNEFISSLREKVDEINEKYGIEKFEIERCMKEEMYYVINSDFSVTWDIEGGKLINELRYVSLNYFKLKTEAKWCAEKMKAYLLELRKEWRENNGKIHTKN